MPVDKIVINASPLILLYNSDYSFVLPARNAQAKERRHVGF
jgi:hypothetical protein